MMVTAGRDGLAAMTVSPAVSDMPCRKSVAERYQEIGPMRYIHFWLLTRPTDRHWILWCVDPVRLRGGVSQFNFSWEYR